MNNFKANQREEAYLVQ